MTVGGIQFSIVVAGGLPQSWPCCPWNSSHHVFPWGEQVRERGQPKVEAVIFCKLILEVTFIAFITQKKSLGTAHTQGEEYTRA